MAIPNFQDFFKPILGIAADNQEHSVKEARDYIKAAMNLSDADASELLKNGKQFKFDNRIAWAVTYLVQVKILERPRRAWFNITDRGRELYQKNYDKIDTAVLKEYPEYRAFRAPKAARWRKLCETFDSN